MIQRVQTLWLLLAAICAFLSFKFGFYTGTNSKNIASYELKAGETFLLMLVTVLTAITALCCIFLFKKRGLQLWLCTLGIILEIVLVFLYYREKQSFSTGTYTLASIVHPVILLAFFMAIRGIYKDEKTVKESDRLR
ncbi:MAG: DUF4293 domain-containing protein [Ferruginibacter sp.]